MTDHDDTADALTESVLGPERPVYDVSWGPGSIRDLSKHIGDGCIPDTYVTDGKVVVVSRVSGSLAVQHGADDAGLPQVAVPLTPTSTQSLLAKHTTVQRPRARGEGTEEFTPSAATLAAVLSGTEWPNLSPLRGIIGAPTLRPDGTLLQRPGYDTSTGFYLAPRVDLGPIPDKPSAREVREARRFLLGSLLGDFPWVAPADKANYLALMATPLLRPALRSLVPFAIVTATMPGSGKTILTSGIGLLVGQRVLTWTHSDEELRKAITAVLLDQCGVVVFDNLQEGSVIDSPVLARLITEPRWSDRGLGGNHVVTIPNDRLWLATGNALLVGGDMASRSVLVRLDPKRPDPERRTGFAIENLDSWILDPTNQKIVLRHLLVLILDWTSHGMPSARDAPAMRQFTRWAQTLGGLLAHHEIPDFLGNVNAAHDADEDDAEWGSFLAAWYRLHGDKPMSATEVRQSAEMYSGIDPWKGTFPSDIRGNLISAKALGGRLRGQVGRWRLRNYVLHKEHDHNRNQGVYWVERKDE